MRHIRNENGWIKPLLVIGILVLAAYSGVQFGTPYYRHSAFENDVKDIARTSSGDLKKAKEDVYASATEYKVPIGEDDIVVEKRGNKIHIQTSWSQTIDILGLYQKTVDFNVDVEE
jgi:hypothetical protein